jgi:hypothetical protein
VTVFAEALRPASRWSAVIISDPRPRMLSGWRLHLGPEPLAERCPPDDGLGLRNIRRATV